MPYDDEEPLPLDHPYIIISQNQGYDGKVDSPLHKAATNGYGIVELREHTMQRAIKKATGIEPTEIVAHTYHTFLASNMEEGMGVIVVPIKDPY